MKKHGMPHMQESGVNVTPLIDIIMCLIIFFILVAKIGVSSGIDKKIDQPKTYLGVKITDMANVLVLNVFPVPGGEQPQVIADIKGEKQKSLPVAIMNEGGTTVRDRPLFNVLKQLRQDRGNQFKVVINGDKELEYRQLQLVLQTCAEAAVSEVNFVTKRQSQVTPG